MTALAVESGLAKRSVHDLVDRGYVVRVDGPPELSYRILLRAIRTETGA